MARVDDRCQLDTLELELDLAAGDRARCRAGRRRGAMQVAHLALDDLALARSRLGVARSFSSSSAVSIGASGLRSSWPSIARNSSLRRSALRAPGPRSRAARRRAAPSRARPPPAPRSPTTIRSCSSVNRSGSPWPKNSPPRTSPDACDDGDGEVAHDLEVSLRLLAPLAEARVLADVVEPDDALAAERRCEQRRSRAAAGSCANDPCGAPDSVIEQVRLARSARPLKKNAPNCASISAVASSVISCITVLDVDLADERRC